MKKFVLTLTLLALASPAWALTVADWAANPIVSGDKTYTLNSASGLTDPAIAVNVVDNGLVHSLNLSGLNNTSNNFGLNFTVTVNSGPNVIKDSRISQNDVSGNTTGGTANVTTGGGVYNDDLLGTAVGNVNLHGTTSITFDTTSSGVDASNFLSNITYDVTQETPPPVIPEPSTFALAGLAVAGLVFARRRAR
jgi:hypothetical protein